MNQETDNYIKKDSQDTQSLESSREEFNKELLDLLKKIDIDQKDPLLINQIFVEITKKVNEICEVYYEYEEYEKILSYYNAIYEKYLVALDSLENSEDQYGYYLPIIRESFEYWKTRIDWLKKEHTRKTINNGNLFLIEGKFESALYNFDHALKYDRNNQELLNKKGISLFFLEKYNEALKCFEDASRLSENSIHILYNIALTNVQLKNISKAIEFYNKILEVDENHPYAMTALGILYYEEENYKLAREYIQKAYQIQKNDWRIPLALGCILSEGFAEYNSAKKYFETAIILNPNSSLIQLNLANVLLLLGEYNKSLDILKNVSIGMENVEDRSRAIILRILQICANYLLKKEISNDLIEELVKYCNLKDLNLVSWDFKNLKNYVLKINMESKTKEILCSILSIPELDENSKKIYLDRILADLKSILLKDNETNVNQIKETLFVDPEQIEISQDIEPNIIEKSSYNWRLYVKTSEHILSLIESVEYILDPNYSKNIQRAFSKGNGFAIEGTGRFDSNVEIKIMMKDKSIVKKYRKLRFS